MDQIHEKEVKVETKEDEPTLSMEEGESPSKSHSSNASLDKEEKTVSRILNSQHTTPSSNAHHQADKTPSIKLLNSLAANTSKGSTNTATPQTPSATAAALQKKCITEKLTTGQTATYEDSLGVPKIIHLPDSLIHKLSEDQAMTPQIKHACRSWASPHRHQQTAIAKLLQIKQYLNERQRQHQQQSTITNAANTKSELNLITIPGNLSAAGLSNSLISTDVGDSSTAATEASTASTNDFSSLPPTSFKNECNSSYEALGLYVANVMNRLRPRSAAKLEACILKAILDKLSEELEQ